jgi:hypothetical protein
MKQLITIFLLCLTISSFSQERSFKKNNVIIQLSNSFFTPKEFLVNMMVDQKQIGSYRNLKPVSIAGEFALSNNFGLGLQTGVAYTDFKSSVNPHNLKITNYYIQLRVVSHLIVTKSFDFYVASGFGLQNQKINFQDGDNDLTNNPTFHKKFPLSITGVFGLKYYVTKHIGFHTEVGVVNGQYMQAGIQIKR